MAINRIKEVAKDKGFRELNPTEQVLKSLKTTMNTWNKWWSKKKDPEVWQLPIISDFLDCEIEDLIKTNKTIKS